MEFRMRLSRADVERDRGSHAHVIVELELPDRTERGEAEGVGTETVELRLAAVATLEAIHAAIGNGLARPLGLPGASATDRRGVRRVLPVHADPAWLRA